VTTIDWPQRQKRPRRGRFVILALVAAVLLGGGTALSFYVESLWFGSLGFGDVFWTTINLRARVLLGFAIATFAVLYLSFLALKPAKLGDLGGSVLVGGQPVPLEPRLQARGVARGAEDELHGPASWPGDLKDAPASGLGGGREPLWAVPM